MTKFFKHLITLSFFSFFAVQANAFDVDFTGGTASIVAPDSVHLENVKIQQVPGAWAHFTWNSSTNSLSLVDFGTSNPDNPIAGQWDLAFDWGCTGSPYHTTWTLNPDGTATDGEYPGVWTYNNGQFVFDYTVPAYTKYTGTLNNGVLSGTMVTGDGQYSGCWSASKLNKRVLAQEDSKDLTRAANGQIR